MSYRIYAFQPDAGVDPKETGREIAFGSDSSEPLAAQADESAPEIDPRVAAILKRQWSALQEVRFDPADLAEVGQSAPGATPDAGGLLFIEPESGARIVLENGVVAVWVPLCLAPDSAQVVFAEIWRCLEALERERGCVSYDSNMDQILNLSSDMPLVLGKYDRWVAVNPGIVQIESAISGDNLAEGDQPWYIR